jgi:hypothetical protein
MVKFLVGSVVTFAGGIWAFITVRNEGMFEIGDVVAPFSVILLGITFFLWGCSKLK